MIYFIGGNRFGDEQAWKERGIFENLSDMDRAMIFLWNSRIAREDDVYILGNLISKNADFSKYASFLRGRKHLLMNEYDYHLIFHESARVFDSMSLDATIPLKPFNNICFSYKVSPSAIERYALRFSIEDKMYNREQPCDGYKKLFYPDFELMNFVPLEVNELDFYNEFENIPMARSLDGAFLCRTPLPENKEEREAALIGFFNQIENLPSFLRVFYYETMQYRQDRLGEERQGLFVFNGIDSEFINNHLHKMVYLCRVGNLNNFRDCDDFEDCWDCYKGFNNWANAGFVSREAENVKEELLDAIMS